MVASKPGPRTRSHTLAPWLAKYTAPWPAELPAPTSATSCPAHSRASNGEAQQESPATRNQVILQTHDFVRYRHLGSELLRLVVGARHQGHASDSSRKTQIVFDPGGGARLATEGAAIQHERRDTLGRRVDCRGEPRGAGAHDGDVIDFGGIHGSDETNAAGQFRLTRIAQ